MVDATYAGEEGVWVEVGTAYQGRPITVTQGQTLYVFMEWVNVSGLESDVAAPGVATLNFVGTGGAADTDGGRGGNAGAGGAGGAGGNAGTIGSGTANGGDGGTGNNAGSASNAPPVSRGHRRQR